MIPNRCQTCALNRAKAGVALRVRQIGASAGVVGRLREMGLGEDQIIQLVSAGSNIICRVCHGRVALSESLAGCILVEPLTD